MIDIEKIDAAIFSMPKKPKHERWSADPSIEDREYAKAKEEWAIRCMETFVQSWAEIRSELYARRSGYL
jgi:hypothetical protein